VISYQSQVNSDVELSIYNLLGQKVAILVSEKQKVGYHQFVWDASNYASGIYYYKIETIEFQQVKKMMLLK
jgi:flagellar hook assembly protein FlgD